MRLSPALARELESARPRLNSVVAAARRANTGFDTTALSQAVATRLDPVVAAVDVAAPDQAAQVTDAGFGLIVTLVTQRIAGTRGALVDQVWRELAVPCAAIIAERPAPVLGMLTNAVLTLGATPGARPAEWIECMAALAPQLDPATLAAAGQVVAWRSGMAHYRTGALAAADQLAEPLALAALGATGDWPSVRAALAADRWWTPDATTPLVRFGGFTGFGGPFETPPEVRATSQGFMLRSGERYSLLVADAFGATLHAAEAQEFESGVEARATSAEGTGFLADGLRAASTDDSVLIASPHSHFVEVRPWQG